MKSSHDLAREAIENFHKPNTALFAYWQGGEIIQGYLLSAMIDEEERYIKSFADLDEAIEYSHQWETQATIIRIHEQKQWREMVYYWSQWQGAMYL